LNKYKWCKEKPSSRSSLFYLDEGLKLTKAFECEKFALNTKISLKREVLTAVLFGKLSENQTENYTPNRRLCQSISSINLKGWRKNRQDTGGAESVRCSWRWLVKLVIMAGFFAVCRHLSFGRVLEAMCAGQLVCYRFCSGWPPFKW